MISIIKERYTVHNVFFSTKSKNLDSLMLVDAEYDGYWVSLTAYTN